jgi:hypothetical protein
MRLIFNDVTIGIIMTSHRLPRHISWPRGLRILFVTITKKYRVRQKYLTILLNSCEWDRWHGEFVLERSSSETKSVSVAMERWSVQHWAFTVEMYFKNNDSVLTQEDISSALQYSLERVSLVAILLHLRIPQEQGVRKEAKDNSGFETEHQGRSGSNFSQHAATSEAELPETLGGMC